MTLDDNVVVWCFGESYRLTWAEFQERNPEADLGFVEEDLCAGGVSGILGRDGVWVDLVLSDSGK